MCKMYEEISEAYEIVQCFTFTFSFTDYTPEQKTINTARKKIVFMVRRATE